MKRDINSDRNARSTLTDHLDLSIQRVRDDLEAVSFWAHAVSGFAQPIPAYEPEDSIARFQDMNFAVPKAASDTAKRAAVIDRKRRSLN